MITVDVERTIRFRVLKKEASYDRWHLELHLDYLEPFWRNVVRTKKNPLLNLKAFFAEDSPNPQHLFVRPRVHLLAPRDGHGGGDGGGTLIVNFELTPIIIFLKVLAH